jgi:hypothetical protein
MWKKGTTEEKDLSDIAAEMDQASLDLSAARSVLQEATEYFEKRMEPGSPEANQLIRRKDHITKLFYVAETMLYDLEEKQRAVVDWLYGKHREERENGNE